MTTKHISLSQLLTEAEITVALRIYREERDHFHVRVRDGIIKPNLARINAATGQENDPDYLAYAIEHVFNTQPGV